MSHSARVSRLLLVLTIGVLFCLAASAALAADPLVQVMQGTVITAGGGEFEIDVLNGSLPHVNSAQTGSYPPTDTGSFRTFCIQLDQNVNYFQQYYAKVSDTTDTGDALNPGVALLFHLWNRPGGLGGYNYGAGRDAAATELQDVLWSVQFGTVLASPTVRQQAWLAIASTAVGTGNVKVLQLRGPVPPGTGRAQDMLIEVDGSKVPEPGTLALLAIGGLPVLPFLRRRR